MQGLPRGTVGEGGEGELPEGRETGAGSEVLFPKEAAGAPGKKGLVLAEERGVSREFTPRPRPD